MPAAGGGADVSGDPPESPEDVTPESLCDVTPESCPAGEPGGLVPAPEEQPAAARVETRPPTTRARDAVFMVTSGRAAFAPRVGDALLAPRRLWGNAISRAFTRGDLDPLRRRAPHGGVFGRERWRRSSR